MNYGLTPRKYNQTLAIGVALLSTITLFVLNSRRKNVSKSNRKRNDDEEGSSISCSAEEKQQQGLADDQLPSHMLRERMKEKRRRSKLALLSMKSPLYDNIDMLDPQGNALCKISARKAKWYICKELADWVEGEGVDNDDCIQLRFEPKKRSNSGNDETTSALYSKAIKENVCVSCGESQNLTRHYIIPYAYRVLMPTEYKSHMSHDIVILCCYCNMHCDQAKRAREKELEDLFKPPGGYTPQFENNQRLYKVRSAALALKNWANKMPEEKIREHERTVRSYFQEQEGNPHHDQSDSGNVHIFTAEQLQQVIDIKYRIENQNYISSHQVVVSAIVKSGEVGMADFVKGWRKHFLETMQPQFMPVGWSVDNPVSCDLRDS